MSQVSEMVIFTRTFDFLSWLLPLTEHFPKPYRHSFTRRLLDAAFDLREHLEEANHRRGPARAESLRRADEALSKTVLYLRLAQKWDWLGTSQHEHAAKMLVEVGKLLGGWQASVKG